MIPFNSEAYDKIIINSVNRCAKLLVDLGHVTTATRNYFDIFNQSQPFIPYSSSFILRGSDIMTTRMLMIMLSTDLFIVLDRVMAPKGTV